MRLHWLQCVEERADHERWFGRLLTPIVPISRKRSNLRTDDPFLLELRTRFGAHIIDGLFPRAAREGAVDGTKLYSQLARLFGPILDHGEDESDDDDANLSDLPNEGQPADLWAGSYE